MTELALREDLLDDPDGIEAADPDGMLRDVAGAPAQLREAAFTASEVDLTAMAPDERPRAIVIAGMGGSGIAGDVLSAVAGARAPIPVVSHRGYGLPGWVGAADLVIAVSCSGSTEETLSATDEAIRRAARVVGVGAAGSPLGARIEQGRGVLFSVPSGRLPRASIWALSAPLLRVADALGVATVPPAAYDAAVEVLQAVTDRSTLTKDAFLNPAKELALGLAGRVPLIWGTSHLAGVAAYRMACQCNENAKTPATWGVLPEASHNQVVGFDAVDAADREVLVLLRDSEEHPQVTARAEAAAELAGNRGIPVFQVRAEGVGPLERLASLVAQGDFASVYLALLLGLDPSPIVPIDQLKARLRG